MNTGSRKYLLAELVGGAVVIGVFSKLAGTGEGYTTQVFRGAKPFNAWRVVGGTHPASGEPVLVRERTMYNGEQIVSIKQVKPKAGFEDAHGYSPENFEAVPEIQKGEYGRWIAPTENVPEGAVPGMDYPVHRTEGDLRRYVILKVATEGEPEKRHFIDSAESFDDGNEGGDDAEQRHVSGAGPADADEDDSF